MSKVLKFSLLVVLGLSMPSMACSPCEHPFTLQETVKRSDVVLVGKRMDHFDIQKDRPEWVHIKAVNVLKGRIPSAVVKVRAWSGTCSYGMVEDNGVYVFFLKKTDQGFEPVQEGCSVRSLPVNDFKVVADGQTMEVEDFRRWVIAR